jgi:hypothetical protein
VNTILYLMFVADAVKGWPVKKVDWISFGASVAAKAGPIEAMTAVAATSKARIGGSSLKLDATTIPQIENGRTAAGRKSKHRWLRGACNSK